MKSLTWVIRRTLVAALLCGLSSAAQVSAQPQYLDSFHYKGSHNSYESGMHPLAPPAPPYLGPRIPLWEQVLKYNCYSVELDLCKTSEGDIIVFHDCLLPTVFDPHALLDELVSNPEIFERFTIINIEARNVGFCCQHPDWAQGGNFDQLVTDVTNLITAHIDLPYIYSHQDFENGDMEKWPTIPQLIARGKNFAVTLNRPYSSELDFFFQMSLNDQPISPVTNVFARENGESQIGDNAMPGDKVLFRCFPDRYWNDPNFEQANEWQNSLDNGWTYLDVNSITADFTWESGTYAPFPIYVNSSNSDAERGTLFLPYTTLQGALDRIDRTNPVPQETFPVKIQAGSYDVSPGTLQLSRKLRLSAVGGTVRLH